MMKKILLWLIILTGIFVLVSCGVETKETVDDTFIFIYDMSVEIDELKTIQVITNKEDISHIEYTLMGDGITLYENMIYGVKAGTETQVKAKLNNYETTFMVIVPNETVAVSGAWFNPVDIRQIDSLINRSDDFIRGVDLSSIIEVIKRGGKFYSSTGQRQSIYQLLKDAGVNYIRIRLWNDPYTTSHIPYGGGNNDIEVAKQIGKTAKMFGMKILLCIHYSDFWADPGKQVIPKDWANLETSEEVKDAIYDYTYRVMKEMEASFAKVDMVQIGNEIAPGMLTQGTLNYDTLNQEQASRFSLPIAIRGTTSNTDVFIKYINAGLKAAKDANPDVLTMIHIDRGGNNSFYRTYFDRLISNNVDFDIIGMSYYIFYHGQLSGFSNNINDIASRYNKPIVVAETSYGFTNQSVANSAHILTEPHYGYELSVQGQIDVTTDIIEIISNVNNNLGLGFFWWEPAWLPVAGAGWAGQGTPGTWANQALFSYQGIRLPSLDIFNKVFPNHE